MTPVAAVDMSAVQRPAGLIPRRCSRLTQLT